MADDVRFQHSNETAASAGAWRLWIAWPFVLIPLLWGVSQTLIKSVALFR